MSITTALKARREALRDREAGFTLIELLIVVIIIGILAAIAIPIYIGVQNNAKDSSVKSDLGNEKIAVSAFQSANNGALPTQTQFNKATLGTYGFTQNTDNMPAAPTITAGAAGATTAGTFCIDATSTTGNKFSIISSGGVSTSTCSAIGNANY